MIGKKPEFIIIDKESMEKVAPEKYNTGSVTLVVGMDGKPYAVLKRNLADMSETYFAFADTATDMNYRVPANRELRSNAKAAARKLGDHRADLITTEECESYLDGCKEEFRADMIIPKVLDREDLPIGHIYVTDEKSKNRLKNASDRYQKAKRKYEQKLAQYKDLERELTMSESKDVKNAKGVRNVSVSEICGLLGIKLSKKEYESAPEYLLELERVINEYLTLPVGQTIWTYLVKLGN